MSTPDTTPEGPRFPEEALRSLARHYSGCEDLALPDDPDAADSYRIRRVMLEMAIQAHEDLRTRYLTEKAQWKAQLAALSPEQP